ncbi:MAG: hypothetical protein M1838_003612 [Thelocarpon superellum]|nr:MAG: hypothetical protein M1838_003612 [Thelocarpon superellum]
MSDSKPALHRSESAGAAFRPASYSPTPDPRSGAGVPATTSPRRPGSIDDSKRSSPPAQLLRQRRATTVLDAPIADEYAESSAPSTGSSAPRSGDSVGSVCLCPPEPKIPRPRNAFMLYRQHFQASVVAQNPGLANPEISKIIGRQWREEVQEVKDSWDQLADVRLAAAVMPAPSADLTSRSQEEKQRHHRQYPNYKYQPRRKGKKGSTAGDADFPSTTEEWCTKCGRRNLTTPATPMTPFTPATPASAPSVGSSSGREGRQLPPVAGAPTAGPALHRRPRYMSTDSPVRASTRPYPMSGDEAEGLSPETPDAKRRKVESPLPEPLRSGGMRRVSLPRPDLLHGRMKPPPRPSVSSPLPDEPDATLTLPPLRTAQSRSIEAMVMTIPYLNKVKVLSKICPPLATPGPLSPAHQIRGAVLAVEGEDERAIQQVARWLEEDLTNGDRHVVRVVDAPAEAREARREPETFAEYLRSIASWHSPSQAIQRFITTVPTSDASVSPGSTPPPARAPVAIIPSYMLSRSNRAAARIPINDAYAPVDHWQWAATLWRGIIGPDVTIWIRECSQEELRKNGVVEVREEARTLVVKKARGEDVDERALRRLGFEVSEALRAVTTGDGTPRGA